MTDRPRSLSDDLLGGLEEISQYFFGSRLGIKRKLTPDDLSRLAKGVKLPSYREWAKLNRGRPREWENDF